MEFGFYIVQRENYKGKKRYSSQFIYEVTYPCDCCFWRSSKTDNNISNKQHFCTYENEENKRKKENKEQTRSLWSHIHLVYQSFLWSKESNDLAI